MFQFCNANEISECLIGYTTKKSNPLCVCTYDKKVKNNFEMCNLMVLIVKDENKYNNNKNCIKNNKYMILRTIIVIVIIMKLQSYHNDVNSYNRNNNNRKCNNLKSTYTQRTYLVSRTGRTHNK